MLNHYTRTVMAWMAERGLRRRNGWTRHVEQLVHDDREPNWLDSFARCRLLVDRALDPNAPPPGHDPSTIEVYADKLPDNQRQLLPACCPLRAFREQQRPDRASDLGWS